MNTKKTDKLQTVEFVEKAQKEFMDFSKVLPVDFQLCSTELKTPVLLNQGLGKHACYAVKFGVRPMKTIPYKEVRAEMIAKEPELEKIIKEYPQQLEEEWQRLLAKNSG